MNITSWQWFFIYNISYIDYLLKQYLFVPADAYLYDAQADFLIC